MKKRRFKLLTKVVFFYLLFTFASFLISAFILQEEANKHMHRILENRFEHREHRIEYILEKNPEEELNSSWANVQKVKKVPDDFQPFYTDTVMLNEHTQRENIYRKKNTYLTVNENHYKVSMTKEADELYRFKDDVYHIVFPVFIVLVVALFLSNYLFSGYLFDPFRRILKQMAGYRLGASGALDNIKTSTYEFARLKQLYERMRKRIESDYYQLKEYTENMSHELQTPLSIIQNKTESLLSSNKLDEEQVEKLKTIHEETRQLSKLGKALNLLTRIENKEFFDIQYVETAPVIRHHLEKIEELAEMKSLSFETELDDQQKFTIDPGLLDIMLRNLLKNAMRYAQPSSVINIKTYQNYLVISNVGNPPEFPEKEIFNRFRRGNKNKTLGLGLAIVKKICEVSDLSIDYSYHEGRHIFTVTS